MLSVLPPLLATLASFQMSLTPTPPPARLTHPPPPVTAQSLSKAVKRLQLAARDGSPDLVATRIAEVASFETVKSAQAIAHICVDFPATTYAPAPRGPAEKSEARGAAVFDGISRFGIFNESTNSPADSEARSTAELHHSPYLHFPAAPLEALAGYSSKKVIDFYFKKGTRHKNSLARLLYFEVVDQLRNDPRALNKLSEGIGDRSPVVAISLIERISEQRTKESIDILIGAFEHLPKGKPVRHGRLIDALQLLTGKGMEIGEDWVKWWSVARAEWKFDEDDSKKGGTKVLDRLKERGEAHWIGEMVEGDILVVPGQFDEVQDVLKELGFPFKMIDHADLTPKVLRPSAVLIFNCDTPERRLKPEGFKAVSHFVRSGGYLFTSDWELQNVLLGSFPKVFNFGSLTQEEFQTSIQVVPESLEHPLMRDVLPANPLQTAKLTWVVDAASMLISLKPHENIFPLVRSPELKTKFRHDTVAANVILGRGSILHVLGHFRAQKRVDSDGFALQQLLANFIIEKQKHRRKAKK